MNSYEDIHEAMVELRLENARLRTDAEHAERLLSVIESLLRLDIDDDPFVSMVRSLRTVLPFDGAMVLTSLDDGRMGCVAADPPDACGLEWPGGRFFAKVMAGKVTATLRNGDLAEWRDIPDGILSPEDAGLFLPLHFRAQHGILVLLRRSSGFDRDDIALARKYGLAASHAFAANQDRQVIRDNMTRALAAEEASKAKDLFVANMSHELRTPLNAIIGFSEVLAHESLGLLDADKRREYSLDIHSSGRHLLSIVNNLLLYTKIGAGQLVLSVEPVRVDHAIEQACRMLENEGRARNVAIEIEFDGEVPASSGLVAADDQALRQILINVIGNAIKFSKPGGTVSVSATRESEDGRLTLCVRDRGCGIPPEVLAQLGNPFVQAESAYSRTYQGTGLGLAICFGLAEAMGAEIGIDSQVGAGTAISLRLSTEVGDTGARRVA